jgi:hypothetical protein
MEMGSGNRERITVETERVWILALRQSARTHCEKCGSEVERSRANFDQQLLQAMSNQPFEHSKGDEHPQRTKEGLFLWIKSLLRLARGNQDSQH